MSETKLLQTAVPSHESAEALDRVLKTKAEPTAHGMYPSDGTEEVVEIEWRVAALEGVEQSQTIAYQSGMVAVGSAIRTALKYSKQERPNEPLSIAAPYESYSKTHKIFQDYKSLGVKLKWFDSGDKDDVEDVLASNPSVLFSETVSNGPRVPVLNHKHLLAAIRERDESSCPVVVLDNTLPTSTGLSLAQEIRSDDKVIVAGSAFKAMTKNVEPLGDAYSRNEELLKALREDRIIYSGMPTPASSLATLETLLSVNGLEDYEESKSLFDERNQRIFEASSRLAHILFQAELDGAPFNVWHPGVGNHPNKQYVEETFIDGIAPSPVFYLGVADEPDRAKQVLEGLTDSDEVRTQAKIQQSFAFDHTALLHSVGTITPYVRVAAGAETDVNSLGEALYNTAINLK